MSSAAELFGAVDLALVATIERFDFPASERPANVRYVGPVFDDDDATHPTDVPNAHRQLVLVSLSTARQPGEEELRQEQLLKRAAGALAALPLQGLITVGDLLPRGGLSAPEDVLVRRYVPHAAVLPQVELVVCHGGSGR